MQQLPEDWLFATLMEIKEAQTRHAGEMRIEFQSIRALHQQHVVDDTREQGELRASVAALKARNSETSETRRYIQTALISTGLVAIWEGIKHLAGWK